MKLQILSDLHIDSYARQSYPLGRIPKTDADVLLVAGDTANSDDGIHRYSKRRLRAGAHKWRPILPTVRCNHAMLI